MKRLVFLSILVVILSIGWGRSTPSSQSLSSPSPTQSGDAAATNSGTSRHESSLAAMSVGFDSGFAVKLVAFPPRNEPFAFRQQLETVYQTQLHRTAISTFVDIEGTIVWTQEYLRYRLSGCSHPLAVQMVLSEIDGAAGPPDCGGNVPFPPRNEPFDFRSNSLESKYRDGLHRSAVQTFVDIEGDIVWTTEYLRYRVAGCDHATATQFVLAQISGTAPSAGCGPPPTPTASVKWVYRAGVSINKSSPAIGPDGTVYVGNGAQYLPASPDLGLFAINPNGTLKWKYPLGNYVFSPVIGDDATVYVQDATSSLYAFTPAGSLKWKYALNTSIDNNSRIGMLAPAIDVDRTVYIGGDTVYAINPDGTLKWRYSPAVAVVQVRTAPAVSADGTIYVAVTTNMNPSGPDVQQGAVLWAINRNGTLRWQYSLNRGFAASSPSVGADGTVYVGSDAYPEGSGESFIYAFNPGGTVKWSYRVSGYSVRSSPSIAVDGTLYVGTRHNAEFGESADLLALNPDGTLKWKFNVPSHDLYPSPAIGADGMIYFGDDTGHLYAVRPDGTLAWTYATNNGITETSPAIDSDGTLYCGNNDGNLFALSTTSGGLANSAWPKFHHDNRNTGFKNAQLTATPGAPQDVAYSAGVSTVSLLWNPPLSGNAPISYVIEVGSASGTSDLANLDTGTVDTTSYTIAVSPGTYYVCVKAKGAGGVGPASNEVVVTLGPSRSPVPR